VKILALYASKNAHGNDARGAFIPQATLFARHRRAAGDDVELVPFDPTIPVRAKRRAAFLALIAASTGFDALAYFGRGTSTCQGSKTTSETGMAATLQQRSAPTTRH